MAGFFVFSGTKASHSNQTKLIQSHKLSKEMPVPNQNSDFAVNTSFHTWVSPKPLIAMLAILFTLKLAFAFFAEVAADEAYYWTWSQMLALSYYDHPPLNVWLIGITDAVFGTNVVGLRAGTFISFAGTLWFFWLFAKRLSPQAPGLHLLLTVVVFLGAPTLLVWSTIVYNDHLLIFLSLGAAYYFADYFAAFARDKNARVRSLYVAAILLGLAGLTKYNAAFMGVAVAGLVVLHPKLRPMLLKKHIYAAGIVTVLCLTPLLLWNIGNDFLSFKLHVSTRFEDGRDVQFHAATFLRYIYSTLLYFGPLMVIPMIALFMPFKNDDAFVEFGVWIARAVILTSLVTFTYLSTRGSVHWYWNCVAYTLMLVYLPLLIRHMWIVWGHVIFGILVTLVGLFTATVMPVAYLTGATEPESARMIGWPELARRTEHHVQNIAPEYLATTTYQGTGNLGFAMDNVDIYDLSDKVSHYNFVDRKNLPAGANALILHDRFGELEDITDKFKSVRKIEDYQIVRMDRVVSTYEFYLGEGFIPPQDQ